MGVKLSELTADAARVAVVIGGHTVEVEYLPSRLTEKAIAELLSVAEHAPALAATTPDTTSLSAMSGQVRELTDFAGTINRIIARLVRWWNVTEDDGETMVALTEERLADVPLLIRQKVVEAIFSGLRMDPTSASESPPDSLATSATKRATSSRKRA